MDRILIVEDEQYIREFIALNLTRDNFKVFEAESGEKALEFLAGNEVELVLLDLKLPGMDGYAVCREIRNRYPHMAVIMVTAKSQDMDKIMGLELGADDYLTKPFNPYELLARIRSVIRRTKACDRTPREAASFGRIRADGVEVKLTPKEFEIVQTLLSEPGRTYTRDQLLDSIWGRNYFGDPKTLDVHVRRLRGKMEDNPDEPVFIETVWGVGYRWRGV